MTTEAKSKRSIADEEQVELLLSEFIITEGLSIPTTDQDIRAAEDDLLESSVELPEALQDPHAVFQAATARAARPLGTLETSLKGTPEMKRAARNRGEIASEIDQEMERDRKAAQRRKLARSRPSRP